MGSPGGPGIAGSARWALERLEGQPFTIDAGATYARDVLLLDEVQLESGTLQARGALHRRGEIRRGAFVIGRGQLLLYGVGLEGDRVDVVLAPGEDWLARRLDAMVGP